MKQVIVYGFAVVLLLPLAACVGAAASGGFVDEAARQCHEEGRFRGAILCADGDDELYRGAFGVADEQRGIDNSADHVFPIQSVTKSMTAIVVLQLVEEERLALDGTIGDYLPSFPSPAAERITLHHLLSHTSGLPDYFMAIAGYLDREPPNLSREQAMQRIAAMPLDFEPGAAFDYSNTGFVLLAWIAERVTGTSYAELLAERIFVPLGMGASAWHPTHSRPGLPEFYRADGTPAPDDAYFAGEGGVTSTLDDMVRYARALGSRDLLTDASWRLAFTPHGLPERAFRQAPPNFSPYGYGFQLGEWSPEGEEDRVALVGHGGLGYGSSCWLYRVRDDDRVIVYWNNAELSPFVPELFDAFLRASRAVCAPRSPGM